METDLPHLVVVGEPTDIGVTIAYEFAAISTSAVEHLKRALSAFAEAGQNGGFVKQGVLPGKSNVNVVYSPEPRDNTVSCRLKVAEITARAFQLLRHMAAALVRENIRVSTITVTGPGRDRSVRKVPAVRDDNEDLVYPTATPYTGFELIHEEIPASRMRSCLVETTLPPSAVVMEELKNWIRPWFELLQLGAFTPPVAESAFGQSLANTVQVFDEATAEIVVDRFEASENAWNVLINMLAAFHRVKVPLSSVTII